jgi:hypothetical protein
MPIHAQLQARPPHRDRPKTLVGHHQYALLRHRHGTRSLQQQPEQRRRENAHQRPRRCCCLQLARQGTAAGVQAAATSHAQTFRHLIVILAASTPTIVPSETLLS